MINHHSDTNTSINAEGNTAYSIEMNASMFTMLTKDVYNDPIKAVIREWSTNAIDACLDAGKPIHFDVHLPTLQNTEFSVRDYGTGLAKADIEGVFSALGASTKRDSNKFNGTFGIGRMAGLAYASTFTVESFHNGRHYIYVTTVVDGIPNSVFMTDTHTDEPNGLRLSIPVEYENIANFQQTAKALYTFFDHKPNLNVDLEIDRDSSKDISSDWFFENKGVVPSGRNYVLMSNVLYEIPRNSQLDTQDFSNVVLKVPTGAVSINPGRESISLSKTSIEYLNKRFRAIAKSVLEEFQNLVNAQPTPVEKITEYYGNISSIPHKIRNSEDITPAQFLEPKFSPEHPRSSYWNTFHRSTDFQQAYSTLTLHCKLSYKSTLSELSSLQYLAKKVPYVILDVKTRFKEAINTYNEAIVVRPNGTQPMDQFLKEAKQFLSDFGITEYELLSSKVEEREKSETQDRKGVYICPINGNCIGASVKENPASSYWYITVTQTTPDMGSDNFRDLLNLYNKVPPDKRKPLVGIQKKYQKIAATSERYTDALTEIVDFLRDQSNTVYTSDLEEILSLRTVFSIPRFTEIHPELPAVAASLTSYKRYTGLNPYAVYSYVDQPLLDQHSIPYTILDTPLTHSYLLSTYPVIVHLHNWRVDDEIKVFMVDREISYQKRLRDEIRTN